MGSGSSCKSPTKPVAREAFKGQSCVTEPTKEELKAEIARLRGELENVTAKLRLERGDSIFEQTALCPQKRGFKDDSRRPPLEISVGQYNILAGYLGNNTEPWFLYGVELSDERRSEIMQKFSLRDSDGKPVNAGWPRYVQGILSPEEIAEIERVNKSVFTWEQRRERIISEIGQMDVDILSLVECDHYEDFFKPALPEMGYDSKWMKRPRPNSADGCCVAWKSDKYAHVAHTCIEYIDRYDPQQKRSYKDRLALIVLLRSRSSGDVLCFVSTHLARNPEQPELDRLRARQVGQVLRRTGLFMAEHSAMDAPVILAGDMNATNFGRLRGIASAVALLNEEAFVHPFTFDCRDVPTGATSCTQVRNVRIDAILYQSQRLELVDVCRTPPLSGDDPIPNAIHPSDHLPIYATFRLATHLQTRYHAARDWFLRLAGISCNLPLNSSQLREAFSLFVRSTSNAVVSKEQFRQTITTVMGTGTVPAKEVDRVLSMLPPNGADFYTFARVYGDATAKAGMPGMDEFKEAFDVFDKDGDGTLNFEELVSAFKECSPAELPEDELKKLFNRLDADNTGTIDIQEFSDYLASTWVSRHCQGY